MFCPSFLKSAPKTARKEILKDTGDEAPEDSPLPGDGTDFFLGIPPLGQIFLEVSFFSSATLSIALKITKFFLDMSSKRNKVREND